MTIHKKGKNQLLFQTISHFPAPHTTDSSWCMEFCLSLLTNRQKATSWDQVPICLTEVHTKPTSQRRKRKGLTSKNWTVLEINSSKNESNVGIWKWHWTKTRRIRLWKQKLQHISTRTRRNCQKFPSSRIWWANRSWTTTRSWGKWQS